MSLFKSLLETPGEWALFIGIAAICVGVILWSFLRRPLVGFWWPPFFISLIYFYYCVAGPCFVNLSSGLIDRTRDMRPYLGSALAGGFVSLVSLLFGYFFGAFQGNTGAGVRRSAITAPRDSLRLGASLTVVGLLSFTVIRGLDVFRILNPLTWGNDSVYGVGYSGAFANYFGLSVNLLIPGSIILFLLHKRGHIGRGPVVAVVVVAALIFINMGFRYRLVLLGGGMAFGYYIMRRTRPNMAVVVVVGLVSLAAMGEIGNMRRYGAGLDLNSRSGSWVTSFISAFGETGIFLTSGAVLKLVPDNRPYVGFEPIIQSLILPIPSALYAAKDTNSYARETIIAIYGEGYYDGAAFMSFAESYLAFGWLGLVLYHLLVGIACARLWRWTVHRTENIFAVLVYASAIPYLYVVFSRGYMPQVVMLFCFTVLPAIVLYRAARRVVRFVPKFSFVSRRILVTPPPARGRVTPRMLEARARHD